MPRYALTIAYDGTDFCGWQKQEPVVREDGAGHAVPAEHLGVFRREGEELPRAKLRTVQEVVERAVREVVREPVILHGASRTDAGVHAKGQVAAFTCSGGDGEGEHRGLGWPSERGVQRLVRAINGRLPDDVLVVDARIVADDFDPVRDAVAKAYTYSLYQAAPPYFHRPLWARRRVHHVHDVLNVAAMQEGAELLVGEHDFVSFAALHHGRLTTVRTIFSCGVREEACDDLGARRIVIEVSGSGFLYNMVRIIAGTLVEIGRGRMTPGHIPAIIAAKDRREAGPTLPPTGLCLEWIRHDGDAPKQH